AQPPVHRRGRKTWHGDSDCAMPPSSPARPCARAIVPWHLRRLISRTRARGDAMRLKRSTLSYGETPGPVTPYQRAAQVWDQGIGTARAQAQNWRHFALGCLAVALLLSIGLIWFGRSGTAVPFVVEVDRNGAVRAVAAATENYRPSDGQIAYHLA